MQSIKEMLQQVALLKGLDEEDLDRIEKNAIRRRFQKGSIIFMHGEPLDRIFFILQGSVKIYRSDAAGREQIVAMLQTEDMFPHTGFFKSSGGYPANAEALKDTLLIMIPINQFENLLKENPELSIKLFRIMGQKIIELQNRLEEQILHNTYEKVILLLIRLGGKYGVPCINGMTKINMRFTNRDLANMIGVTRETISRTFAQLKKEDLIETDEENYLYINPDHLKDKIYN
ncbi:MAG: Crp/Fnr family transcriptional regulator [Tepidibacillus sp.]